MYKQNIFGYISVEFISFLDNNKTLFWAIDLRRGYTDTHSQYDFIDVINNKSIKSNTVEDTKNIALESFQDNNNTGNEELYFFSIPCMISHSIALLKMKDIVSTFRTEQLIYDLEKKRGIIFSISDIIQSGILGIFGLGGDMKSCLTILEESLNTFKYLLPNNYAVNKKLQCTTKDSYKLSFDDASKINDIFLNIKNFIKIKIKILDNQ